MSDLSKRLRLMAGWHEMAGFTERHADLLAAADAIEAGEWREIASAPKDGSLILAIASDQIPTVVFWGGQHREPKERWRIHRASGTHLIAPTHWQPLPPPPSEVTR